MVNSFIVTLNRPIDYMSNNIGYAAKAATPPAALGALCGLAVAHYVKANLFKTAMGSSIIVAATIFAAHLASNMITNSKKFDIDWQMIGMSLTVLAVLTVNIQFMQPVSLAAGMATFGVWSAYHGVRYLSGMDTKMFAHLR